MSLCDPYRDLELYLQQAEDDITKVFEEWTGSFSQLLPNGGSGTNDGQESEWEIDPVLDSFHSIIDSDIKELHGRYSDLNGKNKKLDIVSYSATAKDDGNDDDYLAVNSFIDYEHVPLPLEKLHADLLVKELNDSRSTLDSTDPVNLNLSEGNSVNTATQTSPSLSHSSTNLTWASDCSSSPSLTSTSDLDVEVADEGNQSSSSSSVECVDQASRPWIHRHQWQQELTAKSSSAPVLKKAAKVNKQSRSQSDRHLAEIEATEACKWLKAAGFPQYAQMYEVMEFPIDIAAAAQDHPLLESAVLNSLFRRLQILNRCARFNQQRVAQTDDSEDEHCALSDNWTYQFDIRRWSRNCQNIQIPTVDVDEANNKNRRCGSLPFRRAEIHDDLKQNPKEKLKRAGSSKYRRRRENVIANGNGVNVLHSLSKQLEDISSETTHVSDSECTSRHNRRRKARSLEKSDTWSVPPDSPDRVLWHNLQKAEDGSDGSNLNLEETGRSIYSLSCTQLQVLRKLALLKLTAHMEKYCPSHRTGWNWDLPKFIKKIKSPVYKDKIVFGVPLTVVLQKTGQSLPKTIEEALIWLQQNACDQVGLFRKPGVRSRIQALRKIVETQEENLNFSAHQAYDVADMVKQYFRELPEVLLTNKLSETLILIFQYVPVHLRREAVLCVLLLMPNEHSEVLHILLNFLQKVAKYSSVNQMSESNLSMCFAPSLFSYSQSLSVKQNLGSPHPKELAENRAAHECLLYLLKHCYTIFSIPHEFINQCKIGEITESKVVQLSELGCQTKKGWRGYLDDCQAALQKEAREKGRGWLVVVGHNPKVEIAYKKVADGHPLRLWKVCADIEAPPSEVLHRLLRERHKWDQELQSAKIVAQIDKNCEIFQYVRRNIEPLPDEEYCVVRTWKTDLPKGACLIVETSVEHPDAVHIPSTVRGIVLASRYLIEPCGSGKSRLLHHSRIDTRGRMPEWYHKNYGHLSAVLIANVQNSFHQTAVGPESKV